MLNRQRLEQLTELMGRRGWDSLILYGQGWRKDYFRCLLNVNYSGPCAAAVVNRPGDVRAILADPWDAELAAPFAEAEFARDFGKAVAGAVSGTVAIAGLELMEARFVEAIRQTAGSVPVSATFDIEELRRVKSPAELACVRRAADLADRGYAHFAKVIEPGMREFELVAEVEGFLKQNGAEDNFMLIASGGTEVMGMKPPTARAFQKGDSVTTELTPQVGGYFAQICRTLVVGEPSPAQRESFAIFREAQHAGEKRLKPGVDIADIARAQNDVFRQHGYGEYTGPKYTRVRGHNLGLHADENPYVLEDVHYTVKEGMVIIAHPNTYLPLSGYMVFGDTLLVTGDGCVPLNKTERKLFER